MQHHINLTLSAAKQPFDYLQTQMQAHVIKEQPCIAIVCPGIESPGATSDPHQDCLTAYLGVLQSRAVCLISNEYSTYSHIKSLKKKLICNPRTLVAKIQVCHCLKNIFNMHHVGNSFSTHCSYLATPESLYQSRLVHFMLAILMSAVFHTTL